MAVASERQSGSFLEQDFKACIAVMMLSKTFDIVMAVFDVGSHVVTQAAASISGSTSLDVQATLTTIKINPTKQLSEEQRREIAERFKRK